MELSQLDVGIVGLGTAGMTAAILLARAGARVTLWERVAEPGAVGAGIVLQPTGLAVLDRLGLAAGLIARGHPLTSLVAHTHRGRLLFDLAYGASGAGLFGLGMHRGTLFTALWNAVKELGTATSSASATGDVRVQAVLGATVRELATGDGWAEIVGDDGQRSRHDLVVVANGAASELRASPLLPESSARRYPWGALWYTGPLDDAVPTHQLTQVVRGTQRMVGLLPMGFGPGDTLPQATLYWSIRSDRVDAFRAGELNVWREEVLTLQPAAAGLVDRIGDLEELLFSDYLDVRMWPWHRDRVVVIGDAAHAMSPQLGQGCNMALIDGAALVDSLADASSVTGGLALYSRRRRAQLRFYQWANRWCTPWFQSDGRWRGWIRDLGFGLASRLPVLRGQMVRTMMGVKRGIVRRSLPVAPLARALPATVADAAPTVE